MTDAPDGPSRRELMRHSKLKEWKLKQSSTLQTIYGPVDMDDPKQLRAHANRVILEESTRDDRNGAARLSAAQKLIERAEQLEAKAGGSLLDGKSPPGTLANVDNVTALSEGVRLKLAAARYASRNGDK